MKKILFIPASCAAAIPMHFKYHEKTAKRKSVKFLLNILCG